MLLFSFVLFACGPEKNPNEKSEPIASNDTAHHLEAISKVFDAHGGFEQLTSLKSMSYENGGARTTVNLENRKTLVASEDQQVGFDGEQVWVMPPSPTADRQRMRYNLMFYFYAFPFVVGDPGVIYEQLAPITLQGLVYDALKVSYEEGVGDSPKDNYIILSDQATNQMQWLLYTATFGSDERKEQYSLIKYTGWEERGAVLLPSSLQWYQYEEGMVGEPRGEARLFREVQVSTAYPNDSLFEAPQGAYIIEN